MLFTRIPSRTNVIAAFLVAPIRAALADMYDMLPPYSRPQIEAMLIIRPHSHSLILGITSFISSRLPKRFRSKVALNSSNDVPIISELDLDPPTLLTRISIDPSSPTTFLYRNSIVDKSAISALIPTDLTPISVNSSTVCVKVFSVRPQIATLTPSWANDLAHSNPIPRLPPVTNATFPSIPKSIELPSSH